LMDGEGDIEGPSGYRQQLSVVDDDIQRGIANIDSVLVEEEGIIDHLLRLPRESSLAVVNRLGGTWVKRWYNDHINNVK